MAKHLRDRHGPPHILFRVLGDEDPLLELANGDKILIPRVGDHVQLDDRAYHVASVLHVLDFATKSGKPSVQQRIRVALEPVSF